MSKWQQSKRDTDSRPELQYSVNKRLYPWQQLLISIRDKNQSSNINSNSLSRMFIRWEIKSGDLKNNWILLRLYLFLLIMRKRSFLRNLHKQGSKSWESSIRIVGSCSNFRNTDIWSKSQRRAVQKGRAN